MTPQRFSTYLDRAARSRLLVVGDVMLDRYWFGDVERISPEAPVPVVKIARTEERPGGAANVARNAAALGATATLLSVIGDDEPGATLERLLATESVRTSFHREASLATTVKLRVIGRQQQLLRIDFETAPSHEILATKLADYERQLLDADVVILSDYGKGGLAHIATMIERARSCRQGGAGRSQRRGLRALSRRDADHAEPQRIARRWSGAGRTMRNWRQRPRHCAANWRWTRVLVTRAEEGMSLFSAIGALTIPAQSREVFDVTGAGDTVIATLGVHACCGCQPA